MEKCLGLYRSRYEFDSCGVGFVANISGKRSYDIIRRGLSILTHMKHRGSTGSDPLTGDGAGITIQIPDRYYQLNYQLPVWGNYGTGLFFFPKDSEVIARIQAQFDEIVRQEGHQILFWREVPVNDRIIGPVAKASEPVILQPFVKKLGDCGRRTFERHLYIIRKRLENWVANELSSKFRFHVCSLSNSKLIFKGLVLPEHLSDYFLDLKNPNLKSALAVVHSRFSTNTFPTWDLAQPFRFVAHNGEINTLQGNRIWMEAREPLLRSEIFGDDLAKLFPILDEHASDSLSFDNMLELLVMSGRSIPEAMMMMMPEAWNDTNPISDALKACLEYHSQFMEAWEGPAHMAFTDGRMIGASLDRNGLRPSRYVVTTSGMIILASEIGVQDLDVQDIQYKGRLKPGKMIVVDTEEGRLYSDNEVKSDIALFKPYQKWLDTYQIPLNSLVSNSTTSASVPDHISSLHQVFGYNLEPITVSFSEMCRTGKEPIGSMGNDTPIAILSTQPKRLFDYFKQKFAQVTNPSIDPFRESLNMSLTTYLGRRPNVLQIKPGDRQVLKCTRSVITNDELDAVMKLDSFSCAVIPTLVDATLDPSEFEEALEQFCRSAEKEIDEGAELLILSDKNVSPTQIAIPSLLAVSALHHYLIRKKKRLLASIIISSGEIYEPMHLALLYGFGANGVNPYLAFQTIPYLLSSTELLGDLSCDEVEENLCNAYDLGLKKIMSKMGISTLRSYMAAQLFEALGLHESVMDRYFKGADSRLGGLRLEDIAKDIFEQHKLAFETSIPLEDTKPIGLYKFRRNGEHHSWNPKAIVALQKAVRKKDPELFSDYTSLIDGENKAYGVLRGLLDFSSRSSIPIEKVESASSIMKRFTTGAMSYGSLSAEAHETLAIAMNRIGGRSNSGEGGEDPGRFSLRDDGSDPRSAIKQIASGRFGVTTHYLVNADELQIKIAQGAKPGEGGHLPGHKVTASIARVRHSTPGVGLISPPPHHDIYSIEDLAQLIYDLYCVNPTAEVSVKLASEAGVGTIAAGVVKGNASRVVISGFDGGTGASPLSSIHHTGVPWELGLAEVQQTLVEKNLRGRVKLQVDGQMKTGRDVVIAAMLGAEEYGFSTAALVSVGCVMVRECHKNTCPTGVATQDPELRKKFRGNPDDVVAFMTFLAEDVRRWLAELGFSSLDEVIGHSELLRFVPDPDRPKTALMDFSKILYQSPDCDAYNLRHSHCVLPPMDGQLDDDIAILARDSIETKTPLKARFYISNEMRSVGAALSGQICRKWGHEGLPDHTVHVEFNGSAGQSFGAFLCHGVTFQLKGDANDYVGKGLSGGRLIISPGHRAPFKPENNVIIGNTSLYGATGGEAFIRGVAGERFCVRNSGAIAVVEGIGDHGCEYMTGGRVIVLGKVGRNFAAGMSGGIAYVYDVDDKLSYFCNQDMVSIESELSDEDDAFLRTHLEYHLQYTKSTTAHKLLLDWNRTLRKVKKVLPHDYRRYLEQK